ncbi:MAG: DEAD/DEAH box helicase [Chromatiales bacterium]|jgi:SNF2 family DNA or RNA helicase|nr:DEAD/DEAH box helicase [Chromatiales bacterium]
MTHNDKPSPSAVGKLTASNGCVYLSYGTRVAVRVGLPDDLAPATFALLKQYANRDVANVADLMVRLSQVEQAGTHVTVYPDAEEFIAQILFRERMQSLVREIRTAPDKHPLRRELLNIELLPYQLDGIAFAAGQGRSIIADEMGLGKTVQAIGVAELLARQAGIERVLVICPTSLKGQWRSEIHRFSGRTCQLIVGSADERATQYENDAFVTVCNYEQVLRDLRVIEAVAWDFIILDEAQRIKNWQSKTSTVVKSLRSRFALVLTGTPLENRLDDLYSIVQFVDQRQLGPGFRFFHRHRVVNEKGRVLGYQNLDEVRERLRPVLLRRTRALVMNELPARSVSIVRITPTQEQLDIHAGHMRIVSQIVRRSFMREVDLLRLQKALLMCRMAANGTYLCDKRAPGYSSKLERLGELFDALVKEPDRKVVLFSEWTTMLDLIEPMLNERDVQFVRLDGKVPQKKRQALIGTFQKDSSCRLFMTTNAGSTGLNLQAANTVINVDLPWNPALLEQRIARAHRIGQRRAVQVFVLVTENTLEENLLTLLSQKKELAMAALDFDSDVTAVDLQTGIEELKSRLEVLLGAVPDAPVDESQHRQSQRAALQAQQQEKVAAAGGQLLSAAFQFLGELLPPLPAGGDTTGLANELKARLAECLDTSGDGPPRLTVTLPDATALDALAETVAQLLSVQKRP